MKEKQEFARLFREIQPKFSRFYARLLTQARLTLPQFAVLSQLVRQGPVSMTEISARLHITKPAVTSLVDRLEKNKYLRRVPHPNDRRVILLRIERIGEALVRKTQAEALDFLLKALQDFSGKERKIITRFYARLSETLDQALAEHSR